MGKGNKPNKKVQHKNNKEMKKIVTIIALALATLTLSAKEISKNPSTGMTLSEVAGQYTLTGKGGAIILGNKDLASKFLMSANGAFATEAINHIFNLGDDQFEVGKDDKGMFIIKVGLGAVKLRPSDTALFSTALGLKSTGEFLKKGANKVKEIINK